MPSSAPNRKATTPISTRLTPAASTSSAPTLVGTPVITIAPVRIDSVASSSVSSAVMLANTSTKRCVVSRSTRHTDTSGARQAATTRRSSRNDVTAANT